MQHLIREQASGPVERQALEELTQRLQSSLEQDVPYRPQFRADLRRQLVAQARRQMRPWHRRPAVWGSAMGMVATAAVLLLALNLWQGSPFQPAENTPNNLVQAPPTERPADQPGVGQTPEPAPAPNPSPGPGSTFRVSLPSDLQVVALPDERVEPTVPPMAAVSSAPQPVEGGLQLKQLTARPGENDFRLMANQLAFRGESRRGVAGWTAADEDRSLSMTADGEVEYVDTSAVADAPGEIDAGEATQVARRFLDQTRLPVVSQPEVIPQEDGFQVVYTESVDGRPVVNAKTVIQVSRLGKVHRAKAYLASGVTTHTTYAEVLTQREALDQATREGQRFDRADLVWVRTPGDGTVYLQPFWRVSGVDDRGVGIIRYVAALKR